MVKCKTTISADEKSRFNLLIILGLLKTITFQVLPYQSWMITKIWSERIPIDNLKLIGFIFGIPGQEI